jgi:hypothetical protein
MSNATRTTRNAVANALAVVIWIGGGLTWLGAMALWARMFGLLGLGIGLLTISDLALPFVWQHKYGYWPMRWVLAFVGVIVLALVATAIKGSDEDSASYPSGAAA